MDSNQYVIINYDIIKECEDRIANLKSRIDDINQQLDSDHIKYHNDKKLIFDRLQLQMVQYRNELIFKQEIFNKLSKYVPLMPEIEKAFDKGKWNGENSHLLVDIDGKDYINEFKLDI